MIGRGSYKMMEKNYFELLPVSIKWKNSIVFACVVWATSGHCFFFFFDLSNPHHFFFVFLFQIWIDVIYWLIDNKNKNKYLAHKLLQIIAKYISFSVVILKHYLLDFEIFQIFLLWHIIRLWGYCSHVLIQVHEFRGPDQKCVVFLEIWKNERIEF